MEAIIEVLEAGGLAAFPVYAGPADGCPLCEGRPGALEPAA